MLHPAVRQVHQQPLEAAQLQHAVDQVQPGRHAAEVNSIDMSLLQLGRAVKGIRLEVPQPPERDRRLGLQGQSARDRYSHVDP